MLARLRDIWDQLLHGKPESERNRQLAVLSELLSSPIPDRPSQWESKLQNAISALGALGTWLKGSDAEPSSAMLQEQYVEAMWKALDDLRLSERYVEAVQLWTLARLSSAAASQAEQETIVSLAHAVAGAIAQGFDLQHDPQWTRRLPLLGAEAYVHASARGDDTPTLDSLFDMLCIDWSRPVSALEVQSKMEHITELTTFREYLPPSVIIKLDFWYAMGQWRSRSRGNADVQQQFDLLVAQDQNNPIYRWCKMRVMYEYQYTSGGEGIAHEYAAWPAARHDSPERLAAFFDGLSLAEHLVGLRPPLRSARLKKRAVRRALQPLPLVVCNHPSLQEHIHPVLKALRVKMPARRGA